MRRGDGHPAEELTALLDGELSEEEAGAVRAHVDGCTDCAAELRSLAEVRELVRQLPALELPPGFYEGPRRRVPSMPVAVNMPGTRRRRRLAVAGLSAAAALAVVVALPENGSAPVPPVSSLARGPAPRASVPVETAYHLTPVVVPVGAPVTTAP